MPKQLRLPELWERIQNLPGHHGYFVFAALYGALEILEEEGKLSVEIIDALEKMTTKEEVLITRQQLPTA